MRKLLIFCFVLANLTVLGQDNKGSRVILSVTQGIENAISGLTPAKTMLD